MEEQGDCQFWIPKDAILEKRLIVILAKMIKYYFDNNLVEIDLEDDQEHNTPQMVQLKSEPMEI